MRLIVLDCSRSAGSAASGFAAFLALVASFDFEHEPLLLAFDQPHAFDTDGPQAATASTAAAATAGAASSAATAFASWSATALAAFATRNGAAANGATANGASHDDAAMHGAVVSSSTVAAAAPLTNATVWIATDREPSGAQCCSDGPSWLTLGRLRTLARGALTQLDATLQLPSAAATLSAAANANAAVATASAPAPKDAAAAAAAATDAAVASMMTSVFAPFLAEFDALLELAPSKVPTAHLAFQGAHGGASAAKPPKPQYANLEHGRISLGVASDPVKVLVER